MHDSTADIKARLSVALVLAWTALLAVGSTSAQDVVPAGIAETGQRSQERIAAGEPTSWTAIHAFEGGGRLAVRVAQSGDRRRVSLSVLPPSTGDRLEASDGAELVRIVASGGVWYCTDELLAGRFRPYEAPFTLPTVYELLQRSEPRFITALPSGRFAGVEDGIATWLEPVDARIRPDLEANLRAAEKAGSDDPELRRQVAAIRDALANGVALRAEVATGLLVETAAGTRMKTRWRDLCFGDGAFDPKELELSAESAYEDRTGDPTLGDRDSLALLARNGGWEPGLPLGDPDLCLVDLSTGAFRRVPFQGGVVHGGCFGSDRKTVFVTGRAEGATLDLFEVDLASGTNRRLATNLDGPRPFMGAALSPDGKTLATVRQSLSAASPSEVVLVDIATGDARVLVAAVSWTITDWLPDGRGLLGVCSDPVPTICKVDLEGKLVRIREGSQPILLEAGKRILFRDDQVWKVCGVDGKGGDPFHGGLRGCAFPSRSPDGKRVLMIRSRPGARPEAIVVSVDSGEVRVVTPGPGLWLFPTWR